MDKPQVQKQTREAAFDLSNGKTVKGEVFLRLYEAHHSGPQSINDLLNSDIDFIPVKNANGVEFLNIHQVVSVEVPLADEYNELMTLGKKYSVTICVINDRELSGEVYVNLPDDQMRFKDYINQPGRFFPLFQSKHINYINRRHVLSARD